MSPASREVGAGVDSRGRPQHQEMLAACAPSKIPQLYATTQEDGVIASGPQELPRHGKSQLEQNVVQGRRGF
jgi:hypothetical protein